MRSYEVMYGLFAAFALELLVGSWPAVLGIFAIGAAGVLLLRGKRWTGLVFAIGVSFFVIQSNVHAQVVTTFPYDMTHWVESANGNWIYATVQSENSVAVINAHTLQSTLVPIGSDPTGLALSSDGSTLYVANDGSNFLGVMSTATNAVGSPIPLGSGVNPYDVQTGTNNRLWVLTGGPNTPGVIEQINATTGASTGPNAGGAYDGDIRISPDGNTLYYGDYGLSPSSESKFNVSGTTPSTLWTASLGGNGQEVQLSHDGTLVAFPEGGQSTSIYQTSSMLVLGTIPGGSPMTFTDP